jgi:riboflavin kinase/FMN adenylyltransferase
MPTNGQHSPLQISPAPKLKEGQATLITLGNFDGVHLGHQKMLSLAAEQAQKQSYAMVVLGFDPHPRFFLGQNKVALLSSNLQRKKWIEALYPRAQFSVIHFTRQFSQLTARAFLTLLQTHCNMKHLVVGATTHIGKDRIGTPSRLKQLAQEMNFELTIVEPRTSGQHVISSTYIRSCVQEGRMLEARNALGRWHETRGVVVQGRGIGRTMGYPTANIGFSDQQLLPKPGVYAAWVEIRDQMHPAAVHWGPRPTVHPDEPENHLEVHLLDASLDLYGAETKIMWVDRIREHKRFENVEKLRSQISIDVEKIQTLLKKYK